MYLNLKIHNKILELANKITGNSREVLFIRDLKNKWETAYRNTTTEQAISNLNSETSYSKRMGGYYPDIIANTDDISKYGINNINDLKEVKQKVYDYYKDSYISNENISKPITNIDTDMKIEIWKSSINETFGNANYYKNLSVTDKKIKLATMDSLAKMIKYGEIRAEEASNYHNSNSPAQYYYLNHPINVNGKEYNVDVKDGIEEVSSASASGESTEVKAPMPGAVLRVLKSVGDTVDENEEILVIEAMKMETPIKAPVAGTITSLAVAQNDKIATGQVLATVG